MPVIGRRPADLSAGPDVARAGCTAEKGASGASRLGAGRAGAGAGGPDL
jgi:hypothetical protein